MITYLVAFSNEATNDNRPIVEAKTKQAKAFASPAKVMY